MFASLVPDTRRVCFSWIFQPSSPRTPSETQKQERSVVVADIADSIRHSFGSKSSAEGEAAVKEFLLNLESLDNQPVPELDSFLEILREIHDNPQVAQVVGAGYDFTPASELRARLSPSRSPVRSTYPSSPSSRFTVNRDRDLPSSAAAASARRDRLAPQVSDTDLRTSLESLSQRLDASVANMGREGGSVLGNSTAGNQRPGSSASGTGYKRSLNFVTGQRPAGAPATGSRESSAGSASRTRADRVEGTEGVSSLLSSFASTSRREPSAALARAAQSAEVLRRAASDVSSIGLAAGADHNEGPSEVFGNISSIHGGPSEQPVGSREVACPFFDMFHLTIASQHRATSTLLRNLAAQPPPAMPATPLDLPIPPPEQTTSSKDPLSTVATAPCLKSTLEPQKTFLRKLLGPSLTSRATLLRDHT